jgi:hypothetical protein
LSRRNLMTKAITKPLTTKSFADATGLSRKTIRRLESRGIICAVRDYRGWRQFSPAEVTPHEGTGTRRSHPADEYDVPGAGQFVIEHPRVSERRHGRRARG